MCNKSQSSCKISHPRFNWASLTPSSHRASSVYKADELTIEEKREFNSQLYICRTCHVSYSLILGTGTLFLYHSCSVLIISHSIVRNSFHAMMLRVGMRSVTIDILHVILTYHYFQNSRTRLIFLPVFLQVHLSLFSHTYLLTPWCRVLLEKLTALQLVKKFPAFHGTRRFVNALTSVRHLFLSWPAQSSPHSHIPPPGDPS